MGKLTAAEKYSLAPMTEEELEFCLDFHPDNFKVAQAMQHKAFLAGWEACEYYWNGNDTSFNDESLSYDSNDVEWVKSAPVYYRLRHLLKRAQEAEAKLDRYAKALIRVEDHALAGQIENYSYLSNQIEAIIKGESK